MSRRCITSLCILAAILIVSAQAASACSDCGRPLRSSGLEQDVAAVHQATLAAGRARGMRIGLSNVCSVDVRDDFAIAWVGYKGASGAVLRKVHGSWRVLNWTAVWGGGDPTRDQLLESGAKPTTAAALAKAVTPYIPPQQEHWDTHIQAGNEFARSGDLVSAISEWKQADTYATTACGHEIVKVDIKAADEVLAQEKAGSLTADQVSDAYSARESRYWMADHCNGP